MTEHSKILSDLIGSLIDKGYSWLEGAVLMLPNFLVAVFILTFFFFLAKGLRKIASTLLGRVSSNRQINSLLSSTVNFATIGTGVFIALGVLQLDKAVTSLLAGVGIVGLALGFAFQDLAANFMSGILMSLSRPFKIGDIVETNSFLGRVNGISLRSTQLNTFDGQSVLLPNKEVFGSPIINFSDDPRRRVDIVVGVSYGDPLSEVKKVLHEALSAVDNRIEDEEVEVFFEEFGASSINLVGRFWVPYRKHTDYLKAKSEAIIAIKQAFDEHQITIPFPIRTLDFGIQSGVRLSEELAPVANKQESFPEQAAN